MADDTDRTLPCRCGHDDTVHARTGARSWACTTSDCVCTDYTLPSAGYIEAVQLGLQHGKEPEVLQPWDHNVVTTPAGVLTCGVCGPVGPDEYRVGLDHRGNERPLCVHWRSPAPTPDELATMTCPPWCDPNSHERDNAGILDTTCHSTDRFGSVSLVRDDRDGTPGEVRLVVYANEYDGITPAEALRLAEDLRTAAAAAEGSAVPSA